MIVTINNLRAMVEGKHDIDDDDQDLVDSEFKCDLANYPDHAVLLEKAGLGFGEENNMLIQKSIKRLAKLSGASHLKFFGKIFGTGDDYWIAQGTLNMEEEAISNPKQEKRGVGVNSSVFWVTNNLTGDWIQLPDC